MTESSPIIPDCKYAILNNNATTIPTIATAGNLYKKAGSDGLYWATLGGGEVQLQAGGGGSFSQLTVSGLYADTLLVQNGSGTTVLNVNTITPKLSVTGQSEVSTTSATAFVVKTGATEVFKVDTNTPKILLGTNTEIKGSLTAISSNVITFDDSMLQLSVGQTTTDVYDQGFYGTYGDGGGGVFYRGILYNLASSRWIHFASATTDPSGSGTLTGTYNMADLATKDIYLSSNSTANTVRITATTPSASRVYTIPDAGADASFVLSGGGGGISFQNLTLTDTTNQLVLGTTNTVTINSTAPTASRVYTIPDVGGAASFAMTAGTQTIGGDKTLTGNTRFTTRVAIYGTLGSQTTLSFLTPSTDRTYTIPAVGVDTGFILSAGTQTISGAKTFSSAITCSATSNQITLGTTNTVTLTSPAPAASRTYTIPDTSANSSFVMTDSAQTINGIKTFSSALTCSATTNQITLGTTNTVTINSTAPSASRIYTIPDAGSDATFVLSGGGGGPSFASLTLTNTTNQLTLGTTNTVTISSTAPAASRTYTIPDTSANSSFVMTDSAQTVNGIKTFSSALTCSAASNQIVLSTGTSTITISSPTQSGSGTKVLTIPDLLGSASILVTSISGSVQTVGGTFVCANNFYTNGSRVYFWWANSNVASILVNAPSGSSRTFTVFDPNVNCSFIMSEGAQTVNGVKTFSSALTCSATTNQITLGTTNTVTITSPAPAASRTYTIPDTAANSSFVMTDLAQTVNGVKTFSSALTCSATTNQITLGTTNTTTITSPAPAASRTYTIPDAGASASFVMTELAQTINGAKTFSNISVPVYAFYMRTTANLSIPTAWSGVDWTSVSNVTINPRSWTTTSGQVTPNKAGYYMVSAFANTDTTTGARHIVVSKNGSGGTTNNEGPIPVVFPAGATQSVQFAPKIIQMNGTTDYFYIQVFSSSGTNPTTWPGDATNYGMTMTVIYVGTS